VVAALSMSGFSCVSEGIHERAGTELISIVAATSVYARVHLA
jgi:hypothetical protein